MKKQTILAVMALIITASLALFTGAISLDTAETAVLAADTTVYVDANSVYTIPQGTVVTDIDLGNTKAVYKVGDGRLVHTVDGFHLTGCEGKIDFTHSPAASYSLYSDYYWYEIGDVICIGDSKTLYYCFPKTKDDIVAKARLATEEMYKLLKNKEAAKA